MKNFFCFFCFAILDAVNEDELEPFNEVLLAEEKDNNEAGK